MAQPSSQTTTDKIKSELRDVLADLQTLGGEIRLKAHLASMDARGAWKKLEPKLFEFERQVDKVAGEAAIELRATARELRNKLKALRDRM